MTLRLNKFLEAKAIAWAILPMKKLARKVLDMIRSFYPMHLRQRIGLWRNFLPTRKTQFLIVVVRSKIWRLSSNSPCWLVRAFCNCSASVLQLRCALQSKRTCVYGNLHSSSAFRLQLVLNKIPVKKDFLYNLIPVTHCC